MRELRNRTLSCHSHVLCPYENTNSCATSRISNVRRRGTSRGDKCVDTTEQHGDEERDREKVVIIMVVFWRTVFVVVVVVVVVLVAIVALDIFDDDAAWCHA